MELNQYNQLVTPYEMGAWNFDGSDRSATLGRYASDILVEVAEMTDPINKHIFRGNNLDRVNLASEMADVIFLWTGLARNLNFDPDALLDASVKKLQARHNEEGEYKKDYEKEAKIFEQFREP